MKNNNSLNKLTHEKFKIARSSNTAKSWQWRYKTISMKAGRISIIIIIFYIGNFIYEIFVPPLPYIEFPKGYAFFCNLFFILFYGILLCISMDNYKKTSYPSDKRALFTLGFYSAWKGIYFLFLINMDMPTYIDFFNSKEVSISFSIFFLVFSTIIWAKRYNVKRLIRFKYGSRF